LPYSHSALTTWNSASVIAPVANHAFMLIVLVKTRLKIVSPVGSCSFP